MTGLLWDRSHTVSPAFSALGTGCLSDWPHCPGLIPSLGWKVDMQVGMRGWEGCQERQGMTERSRPPSGVLGSPKLLCDLGSPSPPEHLSPSLLPFLFLFLFYFFLQLLISTHYVPATVLGPVHRLRPVQGHRELVREGKKQLCTDSK